MFDIGSGELLLILIAVLVFFGPKKMPELARSVGRGVREFKRAQREFTDQINQAFSDEETRQRGNVPRRATPRVETPMATVDEPVIAPPLVVPAPAIDGESTADVPVTNVAVGGTEPAIDDAAPAADSATATVLNESPADADLPEETSPPTPASMDAPRPATPATEPPPQTVRRTDERRERENREV